eukprot:1037877-Pleurochrysis_carterae.AAC.6
MIKRMQSSRMQHAFKPTSGRRAMLTLRAVVAELDLQQRLDGCPADRALVRLKTQHLGALRAHAPATPTPKKGASRARQIRAADSRGWD